MFEQQRDEQDARRGMLREKAAELRATAGKERSEAAEQWAIEVLADPSSPTFGDPAVQRCLKSFQEAVNAYWLLVERQGLSEALARSWLRNYRKRFPGLDTMSILSEATFAMRKILIEHADHPAVIPLSVFAHLRMDKALTAYLAEAHGLPVGKRNVVQKAAALRPARRVGLHEASHVADENLNPEEQMISREAETEPNRGIRR